MNRGSAHRTAASAALALASAALLVVLAALVAQAAVQATVKLVPNEAGKASRLALSARPDSSASSEDAPRSAVLAVARGFRFDPRARRGRCSSSQARDGDGPANSRIGTGQADLTVSGSFGSQDLTASIEVFLARAAVSGDIAGLVVEARESRTGQRGSARGRIVPVREGPFGVEVRFDELPGAGQLPPGYRVELKRIRLHVGGHRTVRTRSGRRVRYDFIRNPRSCTGSWRYQVRVRFAAREDVHDGSVACSAG
jgi:hypothetical protein